MQQVLPVLAGRIGSIGLLNYGPFDFLFFCFHPQGIKKQIVEGYSFQVEAAQYLVFATPHTTGTNREHEEATVRISVLQALFKGPRLGQVGRDFDVTCVDGCGASLWNRRARRSKNRRLAAMIRCRLGIPLNVPADFVQQ